MAIMIPVDPIATKRLYRFSLVGVPNDNQITVSLLAEDFLNHSVLANLQHFVVLDHVSQHLFVVDFYSNRQPELANGYTL